MLVPVGRVLFGLGKERLGAVREGAGQRVVPYLTHDEVAVGGGRRLAVQRKGVFLLAGIEAVGVPVAGLHRLLLLELGNPHAALDAVVDTGRVGDDQGRARIGLGLLDGLEGLVHVGTHGDLRDIDIAVAHGDGAEILFLDCLAGRRELGNGAGRGGFGGLAAGVGIDLGIEHHDVDILTRRQDMVHTAEADVVSPAVAAEHPEGFFHQHVGVLQGLLVQGVELAAAAAAGGVSLFEGGDHLGSSGLGSLGVVLAGQPLGGGFLQAPLSGKVRLGKGLQDIGQAVPPGGDAQEHTVAVFGVVLKQGVGPGRSVAVLIDGVGGRGGGAAPDGGAAGGVGDIHPVPKELGDQLGIGGLAAARAGARELEQGLAELAALDRGGFELRGDLRLDGQGIAVQELLLFLPLGVEGVHHQGLVALHAGADRRAGAAARAVEDRDGDAELITREAGGGFHLHAVRRVLRLFFRHDGGADDRVGADIGAEVALDAVFGDPGGHIHGDAPLLIGGGTQRHGAVRVLHEGGNRQFVALLRVDMGQDVVDIALDFRPAAFGLRLHGIVDGAGPFFGHPDLLDFLNAPFDGVVVHFDDGFALLGIGLCRGVLHELDGILGRDDPGKFKERSLQDGVGAVAQAELLGDVGGVDGVEFNPVFGDGPLHGGGQAFLKLFAVPGTVEQENAARLDIGHHVVLVDIGGVVAGDEIRLADEIGGFDRLLAEAQVGNRHAARLFGVIGEIALRIHIGMVADNLDGVFVRTDGAIRAQAPEFAGTGAPRGGVQVFLDLQGEMGHIVVDTDGEALLGPAGFHVAIDGHDLAGGGVLGAQAIPAGVNRHRFER